jgi:hypothetical protein
MLDNLDWFYQLTAWMLLASAIIVALVYCLRPVFSGLLDCFEFFCNLAGRIKK